MEDRSCRPSWSQSRDCLRKTGLNCSPEISAYIGLILSNSPNKDALLTQFHTDEYNAYNLDSRKFIPWISRHLPLSALQRKHKTPWSVRRTTSWRSLEFRTFLQDKKTSTWKSGKRSWSWITHLPSPLPVRSIVIYSAFACQRRTRGLPRKSELGTRFGAVEGIQGGSWGWSKCGRCRWFDPVGWGEVYAGAGETCQHILDIRQRRAGYSAATDDGHARACPLLPLSNSCMSNRGAEPKEPVFGFTSFVAIFLAPAKMFLHPSKEVEILGPKGKNSLGNVITRTR